MFQMQRLARNSISLGSSHDICRLLRTSVPWLKCWKFSMAGILIFFSFLGQQITKAVQITHQNVSGRSYSLPLA